MPVPINLSDFSNPKNAINNKDLAKLGDPLANFIYSLAISIAKEEPSGSKVPNKVLSNSLEKSGLRSLGPSRVDSHKLGDIAEALIAYAWINEKIELEEAAKIVSESLEGKDFQSRNDILEGAKDGFEELLVLISERIQFGEEKFSGNKARD